MYATVRIPRRSALNYKKRDSTKETLKTGDLRWLMADPNLRCQVANTMSAALPAITDGTCISEIMCSRAKGIPESTATFSVEASGQMYNQTNEFVYLGGNVNHNVDLSIEVNRCIRNAWCSFRKYTFKLYDRSSAPLELKIRMLRAEVLKTILHGCVT